MCEITKPTIIFGDRYEVCACAMVYSKKRKVYLKSFPVGEKKYKYQAVFLTKDNKRVSYRLHRLVYESFNGDCRGYEIHHIDDDKTNNKLSNLEKVTRAQNLFERRRRKNKSPLGRCISTRSGRYYVSVKNNNKFFFKGSFDTHAEALEARDDARRRLKEILFNT